MQDHEKLGAFYLGRLYDAATDSTASVPLLLDAKDLTTHAVVAGMTGSGKTGLGIALLEEAAIDGIPAIAIDPKGDLGNLLLTFPEMSPREFRPWIDEGDALREGLDPDAHAAKVADRWRAGLAEWGQDPSRVGRLRAACDLAIYTPASRAGRPLSALKSFAAPSPGVSTELLRERVGGAVLGLLTLLGIEGDPIVSREHILLAMLVERTWARGLDLDFANLLREIQSPPFDRVGYLDLESFFPARERSTLALRLNNLLASPGFAGWLDGEPLDVKSLLWTESGRPRVSIVSIAHLADAERMFFVSLLLNEVLSWVRLQPGTASLRALLYMDEVFGYFPPTASPPSKTPMLTLLKQARAFGLGIVLATQNPADLDYKGLSNTGIWFLGRLQTERDKIRVLEGLEGASASSGKSLDRGRMEALLAGLPHRVFLMNSAHEDEPALFQTRWTLSYLRGPLTRAQIATLTAAVPTSPAASIRSRAAAVAPSEVAASSSRPLVPPEIPEWFAPNPAGMPVRSYRPHLLGRARVHYVDAKGAVDVWENLTLATPIESALDGGPWDGAEPFTVPPDGLLKEPDPTAGFGDLPAAATRPRVFVSWAKALAGHLYRERVLELRRHAGLRLVSRPGESEADFRIRVSQASREARDREIEALRKRYAPRAVRLQQQVRRAEERIRRERAQYDQEKIQSAVSVGASVLGALLGRRALSVGNVGRAASAVRGVGKAAREKEDIAAAAAALEAARGQLSALEAELEAELASLVSPAEPAIESYPVPPRKNDILVEEVALLWCPS